jgi:alkylation response protein AidB-like acyl-CoA dehydrogenase
MRNAAAERLVDTAAAVAGLVPAMRDRAAGLDRESAFPAEDIADLQRAGALAVPLPIETPGASVIEQLASVLTLVGSGNLSLGRVLEAHLNARHLIGRYVTPMQRQAVTALLAGEATLFAVWVTDPPQDGLRMWRSGSTIRLSGGKQFCSAAGHATHAIVTAQDEDGASRMLILQVGGGERVTPLPAPLAGMRAAVTGAVDFSGYETEAASVLGEPGDYMREPDLSAGAWRASAVALGGLIALVEIATEQLRMSGRLENPHTQARLGQAMIARETAAMWVRRAAHAAEDRRRPAGERIATVGFARIAVESACLDAMQVLQRSIGLSSFQSGTEIERIGRDLQTYLRQPAPDDVLTESAVWFSQ